MNKKLLCFMLIISSATFAKAQTPYDDFAPVKSTKKMLQLPATRYKAVNPDPAAAVKYVLFDKENLTLTYFSNTDSAVHTYALNPTEAKWWSIDPKSGEYPSESPYNFVGNNPITRTDLNGDVWTDADGNIIEDKNISNIKVYIFHDDDFKEQALKQFELAEKKYGKGVVALSNTGTTDGFTADWGNMAGNINEVIIAMHGKNQSIKLAEGQQFTATGDGLSNISLTKVPNIQNLPDPKGDINNAYLLLYSCHSVDTEPKKHGSGNHLQGDLRGSMKPIAKVFSERFNFKSVKGTAGSVNYHSFRDGTTYWSDNYMLPYPVNGNWVWYTPKRKK